MRTDVDKASVLVVDEDVRLCALIEQYLTAAGHSVSVLHAGEAAIRRTLADASDVLLLDVMLSDIDGPSVCRELRPAYGGLIVMLSALDGTLDQLDGLDAGADDYVVKPVSPRLLLERVRALLGRHRSASRGEPARIATGALAVDRPARMVSYRGAEIPCTLDEVDLLWLLVERRGEVVRRDELCRHLYASPCAPDDRLLDLLVYRLRCKLERERAPAGLVRAVGSGAFTLEGEA